MEKNPKKSLFEKNIKLYKYENKKSRNPFDLFNKEKKKIVKKMEKKKKNKKKKKIKKK